MTAHEAAMQQPHSVTEGTIAAAESTDTACGCMAAPASKRQEYSPSHHAVLSAWVHQHSGLSLDAAAGMQLAFRGITGRRCELHGVVISDPKGSPLCGEGLVDKGAGGNGAHASQVQIVAELRDVGSLLCEVCFIQHRGPAWASTDFRV